MLNESLKNTPNKTAFDPTLSFAQPCSLFQGFFFMDVGRGRLPLPVEDQSGTAYAPLW